MQITCSLTNRQFKVKKVCKVSEMPKNAGYYFTCFLSNGNIQDIYRTDSGVFYATNQRII